MPTVETKVPTFWYIFPKLSDLRAVLFQCSPEILLTPYRLWRFEQSGSGQKQILLALEHHHLPPQWCTLLRPEHIREEQQAIAGHGTSAESHLRISFKEAESGTPWGDGWAFPLRKGGHLLAAMGFEPVPPKTEVAWVLFSLPAARLRETISDHFTLNNHELRCSPAVDGRRWLWVRRPELYLILKCLEQEDVEVYQSFPEEKALLTPWGYRSALGGRLRLPVGERLLAFALKGSHKSLETSGWWMASQLITIEELPTIKALQPQKDAPKISIQLRFQMAVTHDVPSLWFLEDIDAQRLIEALFLDFPPESRAAISLLAAQGQAPGHTVYLVRDDRPDRSAPLFSAETARGFLPLLDDDGLYIPKETRVSPTLPPLVWRKALSLSPSHTTLLYRVPNAATPMRIFQAHNQQFVPLEQYAHYQIGAHPQALQTLAQATAFSVLFSPSSVQLAQTPTSKAKAPPSASPQRPKPQAEPLVDHAPSNSAQLHVSGREVHTPRLRQLETMLQNKARKNSPIQPRDWVQLAGLYNQEYAVQKDLYWLHEAIKTLDQVLYLDRHAPDAVTLERQVLQTFLQLKPEQSFGTVLQRLDQWMEQSDVLMMRLAFRYHARLLLHDQQNEADTTLLRQHFYRDLARIDDALMLREHYIYVAGVAQYLDDQELYERARTRYRRLIADNDRLQRELPDILI